MRVLLSIIFFFFNDTATTEIYTLSLHDALPIYGAAHLLDLRHRVLQSEHVHRRSEEHTSELQSRQYLVCRLLLEKKKTLITFMRDVDKITSVRAIEFPNPTFISPPL